MRRTGGDVGHGVEGGVGVWAELAEVSAKAGFQNGVEFRLLVALPRFRIFRQAGPSDDMADQFPCFLRGDPDGPYAGERLAEFIAEGGHPGEGAGDFERVDALTSVWHGKRGGLLLEDHSVAAMLA